jgi:hypothetical protein
VVVVGMLATLALGAQARAADPLVTAVGDMACPPTNPSYNSGNGTSTKCRQRYVSDLVVAAAPAGLLDLGDNQYDNGELANYNSVYHPTFGRSNGVVFPSIGNAEYGTANAQGFFDYFNNQGVIARIRAGGGDASNISPGGYYSFNIGSWHLIALNSNCGETGVGGCGSGSAQEVWLKSDLAAHPNQCTLAYWHHPRFNSGTLGNDATYSAFWNALYNARADVVLNGHGNHHYERNAAQTPAGIADPTSGIREFIVSTGGESHGTPPGTPGNSGVLQVADYTSYGVLKLTLHPSSYDWQFVPEVGGSFTDSGTGTCHSAAVSRPSAPALSATAAESAANLSWTASSNGGSAITNYKVYRGTAAGGETLLTTLGNVTSYTDNAVTNGTRYYYRVSAVNSVGEGTQSNEVSVVPSPPVPFPSTGVLDSFARAAGSLGSNWQSPGLQDPATVTIKSSGITGADTGAGSATWSAATFGADQEAYLTVPTLPAAGQFLQIAGRVSNLTTSNVSCYFLRVTPSTSTWDIREKINGAASGSLKTFTAPFAAGDSMGLRLNGQTLTVYRKPGSGAWTSIGSATNADITTAGYLSFTLGDTAARGGAFGGGNLSTASVPGTPTLTATAGDATVHLGWTAPANGGAAIANYKIYRGTAAGAETLLTTVGNVSSYDDNTAVDGTKYYYRVSAVNSIGEGTQSNEVSATATPSVSIDDVSKLEGNAAQTDFTFTATLTNPSSKAVTVAYGTADGTSTTADADYTAASGTISFDPGQTSKSVTIKGTGDTKFETDEGFSVNLASPNGTAISDAVGLGTIRNDDAQPQISIGDVSALEGNSGTTTYSFDVTLSNASYQTITVSRQAQDGTATTADSDYVPLGAGLRTFLPGETQRQVVVTVNGDTKFEPDENFMVKLSAPTNATIADDTGVGTMQNDDTQPQASVNDVSHAEGNSATTAYDFTVSLTNPSAQTVTVDYLTQDGTATTADSDYTGQLTTTLTFTPGQTQKQVTVNATGDNKFEGDESFTLKLAGSTGATIADSAGVGTIQNDDTQPQISITDVSHAEGNSGTTAYDFTVSLSNPSAQPVTVSRQTQDGTATAAGQDYGALAATTLTFAPGEVQKTVSVNVNGDTGFEPDENFAVKLSLPSNATILDDTGQGTIQNDDAQPGLAVGDVSVSEGNTGLTDLIFTVTLTNASSQSVSVGYATQDGTATIAGSDYASASGTLTFDPGQTSKTVTVKVTGDVTFEPDEGFALNLSGATGAAISDAAGLGTIQNDDLQPQISVDDVAHAEGDTGTTAYAFTISLSNPSAQTVTADYATQDGTATTSSGDYEAGTGTVTFDPGQTSKTVTVNADADATLLDPAGLGTIQNDDTQPAFSVNDATIAEGDSGQANLTFTVSLANPAPTGGTVDYATADGTATTANSDYAAATGTLTFDPGQTSKTIDVAVNGDTIPEANETLTLGLSNATGAAIADASGKGTIQNDDHGFPRPRGATPISASLVTAFQQCSAPNMVSAGPLGTGGSCGPPVASSPNLTVGTPDANGAEAKFSGSVRLGVCPTTTCAGSDVSIKADLADVRCQSGVATCDLIPNVAAGPDYTGELGLSLSVRLTDKGSGVVAGGTGDPATVTDLTFPATIPCAPTGDLTVGGQCSLATTANTLVPGAVEGGARAVWQLGQLTISDAGRDGVLSTPDGSSLFAVQGLFTP